MDISGLSKDEINDLFKADNKEKAEQIRLAGIKTDNRIIKDNKEHARLQKEQLKKDKEDSIRECYKNGTSKNQLCRWHLISKTKIDRIINSPKQTN
tara:strand:- start:3141 stop:3428 length:288 start_codon:yes stop_codon:yes gene_type:complete